MEENDASIWRILPSEGFYLKQFAKFYQMMSKYRLIWG